MLLFPTTKLACRRFCRTDTPERTAYVGIDNAKAGRTAAFIMASVLPDASGTILTTRSQEEFHGEAERFEHFKQQMSQMRPGYEVIVSAGGAGIGGETKRLLASQLSQVDQVHAVYSMGGGNHAILEALEHEGLKPLHFVAHDLDSDNLNLLQAGKISFVLHHDLKLDLLHAFLAIATRHGLSPKKGDLLLSDVQVITPYNIPMPDL